MKIHQILINDFNKLPNKFPQFYNICLKQIKKIYPHAEYIIYSGEEIEKIIKNNFCKDVYTAYKKLKPYACKADLARLCLLYLYGGLYIDLNIYFINAIPNLEKLEFFAFRDLSERSKQCWAVQNGIIYSLPKSKILKNTIEIIVNNCKKEYYGTHCVDVSATTVLGRGIMKSSPNFNIATNGELDFLCINSLNEKIKNEIKKIGYKKNLLFGFIMDEEYDHKLIALRKPFPGGDIKSSGFINTNNYVDMWESGDVYDTSIKFNNTFSSEYL